MSHFTLRTCTLMPGHTAHAHAFHQLVLAMSGSADLSVDGVYRCVTREQGCLIPADAHHEYQGDGNNRMLVLDISLELLPDLCFVHEVGRLFERPRFFPINASIQALVVSMATQLEHGPTLQDEISALLLRALYLDLHGAAGPAASDTRSGEPGEPDIGQRHVRIQMAKINHYIDEQLSETICVDDLAALCAMSPGHFHACFREIYGVTPQAYVQRRRLQYAKSLVRHSHLSLGRIAQQVGFCDQGSFSRAYRRVFDVTPSTHRSRAGSQPGHLYA